MNNVECFDDFKKLLIATYPHAQFNERDEMLIRMAINHAYLVIEQNAETKEENNK